MDLKNELKNSKEYSEIIALGVKYKIPALELLLVVQVLEDPDFQRFDLNLGMLVYSVMVEDRKPVFDDSAVAESCLAEMKELYPNNKFISVAGHVLTWRCMDAIHKTWDEFLMILDKK